jgi:hypothetical protein
MKPPKGGCAESNCITQPADYYFNGKIKKLKYFLKLFLAHNNNLKIRWLMILKSRIYFIKSTGQIHYSLMLGNQSDILINKS